MNSHESSPTFQRNLVPLRTSESDVDMDDINLGLSAAAASRRAPDAKLVIQKAASCSRSDASASARPWPRSGRCARASRRTSSSAWSVFMPKRMRCTRSSRGVSDASSRVVSRRWTSDRQHRGLVLDEIVPESSSSPGRPTPSPAPSANQEIADALRDLERMGLEREMAGVEEAHGRSRIVALERLGARRQEERIVAAPHR